MRKLRYTHISVLLSIALPFACGDGGASDDNVFGETGQTTTGEESTTTGDDTTGPTAVDTTCADPTHTPSTEDSGSSSEGSIGQICGNGVIEGTELCDCGGMACSPAGLGGEDCVGLINPVLPDRIYTGGILDCNPASCQFLFDTCSFCGDRMINGIEECEPGEGTGESCMSLKLGDSTSELPCAENCTIDTTECMM